MSGFTTPTAATPQAVQLHRRPAAMPQPAGPWSVEAIQALLDKPLMDLLFEAQTVHRQHWPAGDIELATLLSVKTGGCPENCGYCPQAAEFDTGVKAEKLMEVDEVVRAAQAAKDAGATRFCMGAAWRAPKDRDIEKVSALIGAVKGLGLQTCATLGMLESHQAQALKDAGLDYYNHNLDTAPEYYTDVVSTRAYQDRLDTLQNVRSAGISVCCGGIVGMGEAPVHRAGLIAQLANLQPYPESVPINLLIPAEGIAVGLEYSLVCSRLRWVISRTASPTKLKAKAGCAAGKAASARMSATNRFLIMVYSCSEHRYWFCACCGCLGIACSVENLSDGH